MIFIKKLKDSVNITTFLPPSHNEEKSKLTQNPLFHLKETVFYIFDTFFYIFENFFYFVHSKVGIIASFSDTWQIISIFGIYLLMQNSIDTIFLTNGGCDYVNPI